MNFFFKKKSVQKNVHCPWNESELVSFNFVFECVCVFFIQFEKQTESNKKMHTYTQTHKYAHEIKTNKTIDEKKAE